MASVIFDSVPGRLVAIKTSNPEAMALQLDLGGAEAVGIVTKLDIDQSVAYQAQASLDRAVYVIPFGDNIGAMELGLILNTSCENSGASDRGVDSFLSYYDTNKLSPTNPLPAQLTVGKKTFLGYVSGFRLNLAVDNNYLLGGSLRFLTWLAQK